MKVFQSSGSRFFREVSSKVCLGVSIEVFTRGFPMISAGHAPEISTAVYPRISSLFLLYLIPGFLQDYLTRLLQQICARILSVVSCCQKKNRVKCRDQKLYPQMKRRYVKANCFQEVVSIWEVVRLKFYNHLEHFFKNNQLEVSIENPSWYEGIHPWVLQEILPYAGI